MLGTPGFSASGKGTEPKINITSVFYTLNKHEKNSSGRHRAE
jgi:hypothetical protein